MDDHGYTYVNKHGRLARSDEYWISKQCELAALESAPLNATDRRQDGTWATTDDITDPLVRRAYGLDAYPPVDRHVLDHYRAVPHGNDSAGVWDIEFPDLGTALSWAQTHVREPWAHVCLRADMGGTFIGDVIVIQLMPHGWRDHGR
jgi:hypothetical protein